MLALGSACADTLSGTYVGGAANGAVLIQLVDNNAGQLTGRYEQMVLGDTGKMDRRSASIVGASDGHTVVLTIKAIEPLSANLIASGTLERDELHLSGVENGIKIEFYLTKSNEELYQKHIAMLSINSRVRLFVHVSSGLILQ
jgi:hypothetical protein